MGELILVVPGLCALADLSLRDPQRWPQANRLFNRARGLPPGESTGSAFARALGLPGGVGGLAAFSYLHDTGSKPAGGCARLDPVALGVGPRGLFLASASLPDLERAEVDALLRELEPMMSDFGWRLEAPEPSRWYLLTEEPLRSGLGPPVLAEGESLLERLASDQRGREWSSLLNEIQIILHAHPVNLEREAQGRPQANCLWPWGGGAARSLDGARRLPLWTDEDPVIQGLARGLGREVNTARSLDEVGLGLTGSALVSLAAAGDREQRLDRLESGWLAPLAARALPPMGFSLCDLDGAGYRMGWLDWWLRRESSARSPVGESAGE